MMPLPYRSRWLLLTAVTLGMAPLALLLVPGSRPRDLLLQEYRDSLAHASPAESRNLLREAARLGVDGLPLLVDTLYADDLPAADTAYQVLSEQLDQCLREAPGDADAMLVRLADLLASRRGPGREETRRQAVLLAGRMLLLPASRNGRNGDLVRSCEAILRSSTSAGAFLPSGSALANSVAAGSPSTAHSGAPAPVPVVEVDLNEETLPRVADPRVCPEPVTLLPPSPPIIYSVEPDAGDQARVAATPPGNTLREIENGPAVPAETSEPRLAALPDRELMARLLDDEGATASAAAEELRGRGFQPLHLELARRLVDPDPAVRMTLLEDLPRLRSIDPRPWLAWLTRDADREVRRTTIAIIAVSRDPELLRQLERVRNEELDPDILRFVSRVLDESQALGRDGLR